MSHSFLCNTKFDNLLLCSGHMSKYGGHMMMAPPPPHPMTAHPGGGGAQYLLPPHAAPHDYMMDMYGSMPPTVDQYGRVMLPPGAEMFMPPPAPHMMGIAPQIFAGFRSFR